MANPSIQLKKGVLCIEGMQFYSYHGCLPEETKIGTDYLVDVEIEGDFSACTKEDNLKNTFDYSIIYNVVKKEMSIPSKLIEHVCSRIADALKKKLHAMDKLSVCVKKMNPPVNGNIACSKITLIYQSANK